MNGSNCGIIAYQLLLLISVTKCEDFCAGEESTVIKTVGESMGVNSLVFVQNSQDVGILRQIKLSRESYYLAVANSEELDEILTDEARQRKYFDKRMILITKEKLNFTKAFEKLLDSSLPWIVFLESLEELENAYIPVKSNFYIVHCTSDSVVLDKAYHLKRGLRLIVNNIQIWPKGTEEWMLRTSENLNIDFKGMILNTLQLSLETECKNKTIHVLNRMECYQQEIIQIVAEKLNMTLNTIFCPEKIHPYNYPNGTLSEMFEILRRGEVDISAGSYIISGLKMKSFDFAWPVFTTKSMMYIKFENGKSSWGAYLRPVSVSVWKAIVCLILLTGFLLHILHRYHEGNSTFQFSLVPEFLQFIYLSLQVYCNQGVHNIPRWFSNRIVFILSFLLCVSLYQAYSAFLISSLTVATPFIPFNDIHGFFRDGTYKIATLNRGFHYYSVKKLLEDTGREPHKFFLDDLPESSAAGISKLCATERMTYVEFRENIVRHVMPCKIIEFYRPIFYQSVGMGLPKKSPLREILNHQVNVLRGAGILHRMRHYLLSFVKLNERDTSREDFINVSLGHVVSVFFVVGAGMVLSIIILFIEILFYFLNNPEITHTNKLNYANPRKIPVIRRRHSFTKIHVGKASNPHKFSNRY